MSLGKRVKETRKKLEYTQVKLSELSGITQQTIQKIPLDDNLGLRLDAIRDF